MRIQHNIMSMNAYRNYNTNTSALSKNLEKLSSGYKINRAGDDAAGLAISEKMRAQIQGLNAAQKNVKDSISFIKTAEGAMQEIQDMLSRMKYLATQSANGTYEDTVDRKALQDEVDSLLEEIDRIAQSANFNDTHMLNGPSGVQTGNNTTPAPMESTLATADATALGFNDDVKVTGLTDKITAVEISTGAAASAGTNGSATATITNGKLSITITPKGSGGSDTDVDADAITAAIKQAVTDAETAGDLTADEAKALANVAFEGTVAAGGIQANVAAKSLTAPAETPAAAAAAADDTAKTYSSKIEGGDANALADGDSITIGNKTFNIKNTGGTSGTDIDITTEDTFEKQIQAAITEYNKDTNEEFTAEYADGTITFTAKDGVTPTAAPTFTITDAANKITAGTVEEVKDETTNNGATTGDFEITFQIGDTSDSYNQLKINIKSMSTTSIGVDVLKGVGIATDVAAQGAIQTIKDAINTVSSVRGQLGAWQNRLEHTANNLSVMTENIQDAESTIRDTDVADEMMAYTKNNILIQSAQAMLAQANAVPQGVLQLLQ